MNNETSNITASQVADAIITDNYESENEHQQADVVMAGTPSQEMVSVNIPSVSSSEILVHIPAIEVPILSPDGLPINQTNYLAHYENLVYTPVFPISFGTVDEDEQLLYLLRDPGDQTEAVTFQNQSSGTEPSLQKVVETAKPSNTESHAQENLTARSSEDKPELSFQTVKPTEGSAIEPCAADNAIISKQERIYDEDQFWNDFLSSGSEDESGPSFQTVKETEYLESESCIADNAIISEQELIDAEKQFWKNCLYLSSKIEPIGDTIKGYFQGFEENNDSISETLSKENDPESETFSKEENVNDTESEKFSKESYDPDSEAFSKEENTLASGNAVNVPENQSETFCQR
ncbi:hypothetical protein AVEN_236667-2 [Araneus ventricosus]|nr:hypothetical protein AVEN_236667-2 [Araneus ventricosus]